MKMRYIGMFIGIGIICMLTIKASRLVRAGAGQEVYTSADGSSLLGLGAPLQRSDLALEQQQKPPRVQKWAPKSKEEYSYEKTIREPHKKHRKSLWSRIFGCQKCKKIAQNNKNGTLKSE